ncbi:PREDICTED: putative F-box/kelch-repeat protein At2g44030 [Camelina sativa]|uniref:F-box/kelch-repeat protein At2g44030 n=1 Tax=Camelina sativa TaxID=90675 RepID=A0ABM0ZBC6_CAMSA|nr:PREDICTED: putative F-box/kelch-repeat protein At2g44030 [Camelina sativa]
MREPWLKKEERKTRKSSPTSFSLLPYDIVLNCLARVSRTHHPILSLVSKSFRSLVATADLYAARSRIGNTEECLCVCLKMKDNPSPRWYILSSEHKLIPAPPFPYGQYPSFSAVVSIGCHIYIIGGSVSQGKRSRRVYLLDCNSHQWRRLPKMCVGRKAACADVVDGKIYVRGGCSEKYQFTEVWKEVYDPMNQTWELGFRPLKRVGFMSSDLRLVRANLACARSLYNRALERGFYSNFCVLAIGKNECVAGLEEMSSHHLISVANSSRKGRRVTVWWKKTVDFGLKTEIWCAEILCERRTDGMVWGVVEWSQNVFTFQGHEPDPRFFFGHNAIVTR